MKQAYFYTLILLFICASNVYADSNNFFGANASTSSSSSTTNSSSGQDYSHDLPEDANPNAVLPGLNETTPNSPSAMSGDLTSDEKRMQKKYQSNINNAKSLISKGTHMMESARNNPNNANYKKGKILKEIGEKSMAELKANAPFGSEKSK